MYSILYLFTDSLKMRGAQNQFSTLILIFIISFLTFSALLLTLLFSRWLSQMILLDNYAVIPPENFQRFGWNQRWNTLFFLISYICRTFFLTF